MRYDDSFDPLSVSAKTNEKSGKRDYQFQKEHENRHCALTVVAGSEDAIVPIDRSLEERGNRANYENHGNCHVKDPAPDPPVAFALPSTHAQIVPYFGLSEPFDSSHST